MMGFDKHANLKYRPGNSYHEGYYEYGESIATIKKHIQEQERIFDKLRQHHDDPFRIVVGEY